MSTRFVKNKNCTYLRHFAALERDIIERDQGGRRFAVETRLKISVLGDMTRNIDLHRTLSHSFTDWQINLDVQRTCHPSNKILEREERERKKERERERERERDKRGESKDGQKRGWHPRLLSCLACLLTSRRPETHACPTFDVQCI